MTHALHPPEGVPPEAWSTLARQDGPRWTIAERNALGEIIGTAYRLPDGSKDFKLGGKRGLILPWPLPTYAGTSKGDPVYVCEGASDTGAMLGLGLDAVGVPMTGFGGDMLAELLAGRHVVIVADADDAGRQGASKIAAALTPKCSSVRITEPPEGAKDARAAVIAGANRAAFVTLAEAAQQLQPESSRVHGSPVIVRMSDVQPREVSWLWEGRIPRGRLSLLAGRPGEGKSMLTMDMAARVTIGSVWPDGATCTPGSVVLVAGEDDLHEVIRPRLDAHGADSSRVHAMQSVVRVDAKGGTTEAMFTLADLRPLELTLEAVPDCALVIIDPIGSFIGGEVDADKDNKVRAVLAPLAALAQRTGAAVLLVAHQRKGTASHADDMVMGSRAFTGIARSVLHLMMDPGDNQRRLLLPGKMNLSSPAAGLAFTITGKPAHIEWELDPVSLTADGVLASTGGGDGRGRTELDDAKDWLEELLAHGPVLCKDAERDAKDAGHSLGTLRRAKAALRVGSRKRGFNGPHEWHLPEDAHTPKMRTEDAHTLPSEHLGKKPAEIDGIPPKMLNHEGVSALGEGEHLGESSTEAEYVLAERLGIADELGLPTRPGSAAWNLAGR